MDPTAYIELARAQVLSGKCWTMPAIVDARIYLRSASEATCIDLRPP